MTQMSHYTYFLTAKEPYQGMKYYIGVRSCNGKPEEDSYVCSSKIIKRNKIKVSKQILAVWSSRKEALSHEILLHDCFDVAKNPEFFNQAKQTTFGFDANGKVSPMKGKNHTEEANQKNRLAHLGKKAKPCSEEKKKKISLANKGRVKSAEAREKMSKALIGRTAWNKGIKGGTSWNKGKTWTPEHREAIRLAKLKRKHNESN